MNESAWLPQIDPQACTGCGDCLAACQPQAIALVNTQAAMVRPAACSYCAECEAICPTGAIALPYLVMFDTAEPARRGNG